MIAHNRTQEVRTVCKLIRAYCVIHTVDASSGELFFVILTFWSFRCHWVRFNIDLFTHTVIWYCDGHIADVFAVKLCDKSLAMYIADIDPLLNVYGMEQCIVCNKVTCNIATTGTYISIDTISIYIYIYIYVRVCCCAVNERAITWWRHQMETFSASLAICAGNSPVPGEFPAQRPVTRSFDVFFDLRLNKRLS